MVADDAGSLRPPPKRARFGPNADAPATMSGVPAGIDVERFANTRRAEITAMETAIKTSRDSGAKRAFQSLPRHLRRRAASHNIRRLPKRLRAKAKFEVMHEQTRSLKKRKFRQLPIAKRRKLLKFGRMQILHHRQRNKAWLETHIWHAKRMKMVDTWGYRLAETPTAKSFRPSYRAAMHGVIVHDASYYQTIELRGTVGALTHVLARICDATAVPASSKRFTSGVRECRTILYGCEQFPYEQIGPASIIWNAVEVDDIPLMPRIVVIRFHPSILRAVTTAVTASLQVRSLDYVSPSPPSTPVVPPKMYFRNFCTFELTGPMATDTIKACFRPTLGGKFGKQGSTSFGPRPLAAMVKFSWDDIPCPSSVPEGTVLSFDVYDPRLTFPPKLSALQQSLGKPSTLWPSVPLAINDRFWSSTIRKSLVAPRYSKFQLDERRAQLLIPGSNLPAQTKDDRIPIMLVQRTLGCETVISAGGSPTVSREKSSIYGWTLIVPAGWGAAFWHSLVYADTRVGGLQERAQQYFEAAALSFPCDWLPNPAAQREVDAKAKVRQEKWERTPPAKRVNYQKLQTLSPWKPDFLQIAEQTADAGIERPLILWCLPGSMIKKVLDTVLQQIKRNSAREAQPQLLRSSVRQVVQHAREKRELVAAPFNGNWDASFPLVRVAMHPLGRGSPKDNAMIYSMEAEQAERVRHSIRSTSQGHVERRIENGQSSVSAKNAATVTVPMNAKGARRTTASMLMDDGEGHLDTETQNNDVDPDDDFDKDEDEDGDDGSEDAIHHIPVPPNSSMIGYLTTGHQSLARGQGMGIGCISLSSLVAILVAEQQLNLKSADAPLLVLFRNPSSTTVRAARLELLT